jgi:hypothetical protein
MIDPQTEQLVTFAEATKLIPGRPHLSQTYRWAERGLGGIKLEWIKAGGKRFTSVEALSRFYAALTKAAGGEAPTPSPLKARAKQQDRAVAELQDAGFEVGATGVSA